MRSYIDFKKCFNKNVFKAFNLSYIILTPAHLGGYPKLNLIATKNSFDGIVYALKNSKKKLRKY